MNRNNPTESKFMHLKSNATFIITQTVEKKLYKKKKKRKKNTEPESEQQTE